MAQIIVINDTGAQIAAAAVITLDGVNKVPPVRYVNSGALVTMYNKAATTTSATTVVLAATASAPSSGNYAYRASDKTIKLGVAMETYHMLVLDVELEDEYVRT